MQAVSSITKQSWRFIGFWVALQAVLALAVDRPNSEFNQELAAAKQAVERNDASDAISLQQSK